VSDLTGRGCRRRHEQWRGAVGRTEEHCGDRASRNSSAHTSISCTRSP